MLFNCRTEEIGDLFSWYVDSTFYVYHNYCISFPKDQGLVELNCFSISTRTALKNYQLQDLTPCFVFLPHWAPYSLVGFFIIYEFQVSEHFENI